MKIKKLHLIVNLLVLTLSLTVISGFFPATFSFENEYPESIEATRGFGTGSSTPPDYTFETGWWKFDLGIGTTAFDSVEGNQNGTIYGANWTSDSKLGDYALKFDGIDDYVNVDYNLPNVDYTISAWYKTTADGYREIIAEGLGGESRGTNVQELLIHGDTEIRFKTETGSGVNHDYIFTVSGNLTDGQWHFIAAVVTSGLLSVYWDDQKFNTTSFITSDTTADNCWIGCYGGPGTGTWFEGTMDDARIFECPLTDEEVSWLYNNGNGREEKLNDHEYKFGWWKLDEGTGSIAEDSIEGDQNGIIYGANWTTDCKIGEFALEFDGLDDCVDVNYNIPNVGYTMCA